MKPGDLLFVYGTLRRGESADLDTHKTSTYVGTTRINGALYNLGWFPGVRLPDGGSAFIDSEPTVVGDVFEIGTTDLVRTLDSYEGYPSLYGRSQVQTEDGRTVWVYTYNGFMSEGSRIQTGDWCHQVATPSILVPNAA